MGIYDREYYRREGPGFLSALSRSGQVCTWLVAINAGAFLLQVFTLPRGGGGLFAGPFTDLFQLDTARVLDGQVWRLLTYAFLHAPGDLLHIVFNMLFLWWFGRELEGMYGSREFLTFYLLSALLGGLAFEAQGVLVSYHETGSLTQHAMSCVGASGAVTAVMVLFACHFPHRSVYLFFVLRVPIWAMVVLMVAVDTFYFVGGGRTQTAVTVHLAGAAFGFLYYKLQWRFAPLWTGLFSWRSGRSRPRLRVYRGEAGVNEPARVSTPGPASAVDEQLEAKLDAVLEKVARSGQASLTDSERETLFRASEIYKRRRT